MEILHFMMYRSYFFTYLCSSISNGAESVHFLSFSDIVSAPFLSRSRISSEITDPRCNDILTGWSVRTIYYLLLFFSLFFLFAEILFFLLFLFHFVLLSPFPFPVPVVSQYPVYPAPWLASARGFPSSLFAVLISLALILIFSLFYLLGLSTSSLTLPCFLSPSPKTTSQTSFFPSSLRFLLIGRFRYD